VVLTWGLTIRKQTAYQVKLRFLIALLGRTSEPVGGGRGFERQTISLVVADAEVELRGVAAFLGQYLQPFDGTRVAVRFNLVEE
jgi:hypothetical protein